MSETEFDQFETRYDDEISKAISFGGQGHDFYMQVKVDAMLEVAQELLRKPLASCRFLDVGCGVGATSRLLVNRVGSLDGVDVSEGLVKTAREQVEGVAFSVYDGHRLPYEDDSFDAAFAICVMHHVPPDEWTSFCQEVQRVLKPGGLFFVFEHNQFNPGTMRVVNTCVFDEHAVLLKMKKTKELMLGAGLELADSRYILFFPFKGRAFRLLDSWLRWLPLGAQYSVVGKKSLAS